MLPDEFFPLVVECLQDNGYAVTLGPDYSLSEAGGSYENRGALKETFDECAQQIDPSYLEDPPPFTEAQLKALYDYVNAQVTC